MTIEADIYNALKGLVSNRVYADVAPAGAVAPYLTYQQVGGTGRNFLEATVPSKKNGRFQINCWADSRISAAALSRQVEDAMVTTLKAFVLGAPVAMLDADTGLRGTTQDFSLNF